MGEVYRAHDPRMGREVAIKVSAERFSDRFEREVRAVAALNHPNICQIYDVGPNYLVMELVEGPTLAERINSGAIPLEEWLAIARQIAEAMEAAHEKRITHRDLKPANVKITPQGVVKVLDFGLAKIADPVAAAPGVPDASPTLTLPQATRVGVILGTAAYMSPEQASGKPVDKRTDIWSFGVVQWEMLTGHRLFDGETISHVLADVLRGSIDFDKLPKETPRAIRELLKRCLDRDVKTRLRDIGEARIILTRPMGGTDVPQRAEARPAKLPWAVAAALLVALAIAGWGWWRGSRSVPPHSPIRLNAVMSPATTLDRFRGSQLALSPDGTRIVVAESDRDGKWRLVMRSLDQSQFAPLSGAEQARTPFFSPDGQWIAFFAGGKLKKIPVQGGSPVTLCDAPAVPGGASWGDDGNIVAAFNSGAAGLVRVPSGGGASTAATELNKEKGQTVYTWPQVLPGSQSVLVTTYSIEAVRRRAYDAAEIDVVSMRTGERKTVQQGGFFGRYLLSGHLVYLHESTLFAAPFDLSRLAVTGSPQPVLEEVNVNVSGGGDFDFSQTGTLVYVSSKGQRPSPVLWLDTAGRTQPLLTAPGTYENPRFSPDGKRLAFELATSPVRADIWMKDLERDTISRLTHLPGRNNDPVWTPDGKSVVFRSYFQANGGLYWIRADGVGEAQRLTDGQAVEVPYSFSPDGKQLAFSRNDAVLGSEIWTVPVEGDRDHPRLGKAEPFLRTSFFEGYPAFSPDGRWLAYSSNETGRFEVYVRPFPGPGSKSQISIDGGSYPIWSRNGRELFFLTLDWRIMAADYTANANPFAAGKPKVWSPTSLLYMGGNYPYDLAADGKRFAVNLYPGGTVEREQRLIDSVTVLLNFFDELRRRVLVAK
jgi:serine/threonine-protein kinase